MSSPVVVGRHTVGGGSPVYVIAEIGLNHNGDVEIAKRLMYVAKQAGAQAVKFQKRTPELSTPPHMRHVVRETPWGAMTYLDYRHRVEFGRGAYSEIASYADTLELDWYASPWDLPSVDFLEEFDVPAHKVASASLTDDALLKRLRATGKPLLASTGMSTAREIDHAVSVIGTENLVLLHATSTYPMPAKEANLSMISTLQARYPDIPVGYSGHELGLQISTAAVALGAEAVERHITLDRTMWGSDQAASLEPRGLELLIRDIRIVAQALGDGVKRVYPGELAQRSKLRSVVAEAA